LPQYDPSIEVMTQHRRRAHPRGWRAAAGAGALAAAVLAAGCAAPPPHLLLNGITADRSAPGGIAALPVPGHPGRAAAPGTAAPGTAAGSAAGPGRAEQRWLSTGTVPGRTPAQRQLARTSLADLRLLTMPNGAVAAAWYGRWKFAWPRDSSWVAAAFAATGHRAEALRILAFLARVQDPSGRWAARYRLSGQPVWTGLATELDADGWFPWAVWVWYAQAPDRAAARRQLAGLWPAVRRAADHTAGSLTSAGLPPPSPDYWEQHVTLPTIGTAAPLLTGLRASARLAGLLGDTADAGHWSAAAARLNSGIQAAFGPDYPRFPASTGGTAGWLALFGTGPGRGASGRAVSSILNGADSAVTFLGPPFASPTPSVSTAIRQAARVLTLPDGGILPGTTWHGSRTTAWTPSTAFFALSDAASGDTAGEMAWLRWLAAHRTTAGELPEQVDVTGQPVSVAPLAWADAIVLLALTALDHPLPVP
jgi:glucoamylase